ncbi:MAG TPA: ZIP family metal transporter [Steroidobacteraceae bacterium]|nr:ZIP family metal transporter [Steroidobacteraceae bacterium]
MSTLAWIIALTTFGGALSALAASSFLLLPDRSRTALLPHLVSFATGALLGAALLALLPHAIQGAGVGNTHYIGLTLLAGILAFFVLEKLVLWRHCHHEDCEAHVPGDHHRDRASATLILFGDGFHNVLDGVLIAAAFLTDHHLGVVTAIAVFAHEIPQEVGDLAILLNGGLSRRRALVLNLLASLTSVVGGIVAYFLLGPALHLLPYALAIAASSFLYVAVADLIPGLHRQIDMGSGVAQLTLIALGVVVIYFSHATLH